MKKRAIVWMSLVLTFTPVAYAQPSGEAKGVTGGMLCEAYAKRKKLPQDEQSVQPVEKKDSTGQSTRS